MAVTVLYVALTVLFVMLTVSYAALTVLYMMVRTALDAALADAERALGRLVAVPLWT